MAPSGVKVYYDGRCHLCSREMEHYRREPGGENLEFVDITTPWFQPVAEGLDPVRVHRAMHVRRSDGTLAVGVEAVLEIWEHMPRYRLAARLGRSPLPNLLLRLGYRVFAAARPWLPKRRRRCGPSPHCDLPGRED
jgi:predicted DCC family thiol-disulfide oxidoreductase YuxK